MRPLCTPALLDPQVALTTCRRYRFRIIEAMNLTPTRGITLRRRQWDWRALRFVTHSYRVLLYDALEKFYPGAAIDPHWEAATFTFTGSELGVEVVVYRPRGEDLEQLTLLVYISAA